ncbi:MAG: metallophosphoesterase family protein, partial [Bacteroidia bacterium]|nr:metallophosphoesterase family protein [Bacteroidia bacterium]
MKIEKISVFVLFIFCIQFTFSQVSPELQKKWDKESSTPENPLLRQEPSHLPDRVIITPLESDNNSLAITWRTDTTVKEGRVEIIEGDAYRFSKDNREREEAAQKVVEYKDYPMHYHTATVQNLKPGKTYKYRVGNSPDWSPWYTYKHQNFTDTVSLLYFGDVQNRIFDHSGRIFSEALKNFGNAKLALFIGDLINHANNDYEWSEWHTAAAGINSSIPVIATPGNHEYLKNLEGHKTDLSAYWTSVFPYPYTWDAGQFYLDYGFVRFIVMNSNDNIYEQGKWLEQILSETTQDWVVIVSHHPVFSGAKD